MQFNVPQFIEVEDKIIGPLNWKQFLYLLVGAVVLFLLWTLIGGNFIVFLFFAIPIGGFFLALAFLKINGRPFLQIFLAFVNYFLKPKLYIWRKK